MHTRTKKLLFYILISSIALSVHTDAKADEDDAFEIAKINDTNKSGENEEQISEEVYESIKEVKTPAVEFLGSSKFTTNAEAYKRFNKLEKSLSLFKEILMSEYRPTENKKNGESEDDTKSEKLDKKDVKEMIKEAVKAAVNATAQPATATIEKNAKPKKTPTNPFLKPIAIPGPTPQKITTPIAMPTTIGTNFSPIPIPATIPANKAVTPIAIPTPAKLVPNQAPKVFTPLPSIPKTVVNTRLTPMPTSTPRPSPGLTPINQPGFSNLQLPMTNNIIPVPPK